MLAYELLLHCRAVLERLQDKFTHRGRF
jgi:hypothetical protein